MRTFSHIPLFDNKFDIYLGVINTVKAFLLLNQKRIKDTTKNIIHEFLNYNLKIMSTTELIKLSDHFESLRHDGFC